jgi:hypothetical protein
MTRHSAPRQRGPSPAVHAPRGRSPVAAPRDASRTRTVSASSRAAVAENQSLPRLRRKHKAPRRHKKHTRREGVATSSHGREKEIGRETEGHRDDKSRQQHDRPTESAEDTVIAEQQDLITGCDRVRGHLHRCRSRGKSLTPAALPHSSAGSSHDEPVIYARGSAKCVLGQHKTLLRRAAMPARAASCSDSNPAVWDLLSDRSRGQKPTRGRSRSRSRSRGKCAINRQPHHVEEVPPLEKCALNLMLATWLLGRDADPLALEAKLESTTFDCVVVVFTRGVLDDSPVAEFFRHLVEGNCRYKDTVLKEKSVCRLNSKEFAVMHRWKVHNHTWRPGKIREGKPLCVEMGTLSLMLNTERQDTKIIRVGVIRVHAAVADMAADLLVDFITRERISVLTGYFGKEPAFLSDVAPRAGAIHPKPLFQSCHGRNHIYDLTPPIWMICFGTSKNNIEALPSFKVPDDWFMGEDVWEEMIGDELVPNWSLHTSMRGISMPCLGNVKSKKVEADTLSDFWVPHSFQLCIWLGHSTPGQHRNARRKGRGKGNGNGKGKGKGKCLGQRQAPPQQLQRQGERQHGDRSRGARSRGDRSRGDRSRS